MAFVVRLEGRIWAFLQELAIRPVMGAGIGGARHQAEWTYVCFFLSDVSPCPKALRAGLTAPRCVLSARLHQDGPGGDEDSGAGSSRTMASTGQ